MSRFTLISLSTSTARSTPRWGPHQRRLWTANNNVDVHFVKAVMRFSTLVIPHMNVPIFVFRDRFGTMYDTSLSCHSVWANISSIKNLLFFNLLFVLPRITRHFLQFWMFHFQSRILDSNRNGTKGSPYKYHRTALYFTLQTMVHAKLQLFEFYRPRRHNCCHGKFLRFAQKIL